MRTPYDSGKADQLVPPLLRGMGGLEKEVHAGGDMVREAQYFEHGVSTEEAK